MSNPTREVQPRKPYAPPAITQLRPTNNPSSSLLEQLRSTLEQLDVVLSLNTNDSAAAELEQALLRALAEQESVSDKGRYNL